MKKHSWVALLVLPFAIGGAVSASPMESGAEDAILHPGDANSDWRMVMSEAIPYLTGWQNGANPMAYAIRAAYLWQNGEHYHWDDEASPPLCWVLGAVEPEGEAPEGEQSDAYRIEEKQAEENYEYQFFHEQHHFMTLLESPDGAVAFRPHPGVDINGWGSSWYINAFLPSGNLSGATVDTVNADDAGIHVALSGTIGQGLGTWAFVMTFSDIRSSKSVTGTGEYTVTLVDVLTGETGDLNLGKIASNYLDDVPLLGGGYGDTGDMATVDVLGGNVLPYDFQFTWSPPVQPSHYPIDQTDRLSVQVSGAHNIVDTAVMGYAPIAAAYKPSLHLTLASRDPGAGLTFGAAYDLAHAQDFWEDNVGITPLIRVGNPRTVFNLDLEFTSTALPGDGE